MPIRDAQVTQMVTTPQCKPCAEDTSSFQNYSNPPSKLFISWEGLGPFLQDTSPGLANAPQHVTATNLQGHRSRPEQTVQVRPFPAFPCFPCAASGGASSSCRGRSWRAMTATTTELIWVCILMGGRVTRVGVGVCFAGMFRVCFAASGATLPAISGVCYGVCVGGMFRGMLRDMFRGCATRVPFLNLSPPKKHKPICM